MRSKGYARPGVVHGVALAHRRNPWRPVIALVAALSVLTAALPVSATATSTPQIHLLEQEVVPDRPFTAAADADAPNGPIPIPKIIRSRVYHTYYDMTTELQDLAAAHPDIAKLSSLGKSIGGRDLWVMRITNFATLDAGNGTADNGSEGGRWTAYIDGGHHGNEQLGMELAILMIHYLLDDYGGDPLATRFVDAYDIWVTPMVNPDGNVKDNRENNNNIDLNRNYDFEWTDESNHGSGPFSEPESRANGAGMAALDFDFYLSYHTGVDEILLPWAYTTDLAPDDEMYVTVGGILTNLTGIPAVRTGSGLYVATGSSMDYAYGALGAPASTIEVDSTQWRWLTAQAVEDRLSEEFEASVWFLEHIAELRARLSVSAWSLSGGSGRDLHLSLDVENLGYGTPNGTTVTVGSTTGVRIVDVEGNATIPAKGTSVLNMTLVTSHTGRVPLEINITYRELQVNSSRNVTTLLTLELVIPQGSAVIIGGLPLAIAVLIASVVAVVLLVLRRRSRRL